MAKFKVASPKTAPPTSKKGTETGVRGQSPQKRPEGNAKLYKKHTAVLVSSLVIVTKAVILAQEKSMLSGFEEFLILV